MNMNFRKIGVTALCCCAIFAVSVPIAAQTMTKGLVAEKILRVEDGVDEFRDYLERRGDNARDASSTAQQSGRASTAQQNGRASGRRGTANTDSSTQIPMQERPPLNQARTSWTMPLAI